MNSNVILNKPQLSFIAVRLQSKWILYVFSFHKKSYYRALQILLFPVCQYHVVVTLLIFLLWQSSFFPFHFFFLNSVQSWEGKKREILHSECHSVSCYLSQSFPILLTPWEQWVLWFAPNVMLSAVVVFCLSSEKDHCDSSKLLWFFLLRITPVRRI